MHDLLLQEGKVYDLESNRLITQDIAIRGNQISKVATNITEPAKRVLSLSGKVVLPGLIISSHKAILQQQALASGVTTVITPEMPSPSDPISENQHTMISVAQLRARVMGDKRSMTVHASITELRKLQEVTEHALQEEAIGISMDFRCFYDFESGEKAYNGADQASQEEFSLILKCCANAGKVFSITLYSKQMKVLWAHLAKTSKWVGKPMRLIISIVLEEPRLKSRRLKVLQKILHYARTCLGLNVHFRIVAQTQPMIARGVFSPLFYELHCARRLVHANSAAIRKSLLRDVDFCSTLKYEWLLTLARHMPRRLERIYILEGAADLPSDVSVAQLAKSRERTPLEFFIELLTTYDSKLIWEYRPVVSKVAMCANKSWLPPITQVPGDNDSARAFQLLCGSEDFLSAVKNYTSHMAQAYGLTELGQLSTKKRANVIVLDNAQEKIEHVIFNGVMVE